MKFNTPKRPSPTESPLDMMDEKYPIVPNYPKTGGFFSTPGVSGQIIVKKSGVKETIIPKTKSIQNITPEQIQNIIQNMNETEVKTNDLLKVEKSIENLLEECTLMV